jgi:hypothetical protein
VAWGDAKGALARGGGGVPCSKSGSHEKAQGHNIWWANAKKHDLAHRAPVRPPKFAISRRRPRSDAISR